MEHGDIAKSGQSATLIKSECEGSNPSIPTCEKHNEAKVLHGKKTKRWQCRSCNREYQATWFKDNKEVQLARVMANSARVRKENHALIRAYKEEHPCVDCGEADWIVLDFDHRDQDSKEFNISAKLDIQWDRLYDEIQKCEVRCANCHRRRTAIQLGWYA